MPQHSAPPHRAVAPWGRRRLLAALGCAGLGVAAGPGLVGAAAPAPQRFGTAVDIGPDLSLILADGPPIRPAALEVPPHDGRARARLTALLAGGQAGLDCLGVDRYGQARCHLFDATGAWVQADLVCRGLVRVRTSRLDRRHAPALLVLEAEARRARRGLWAQARFRPVPADRAGGLIGGFGLVEGRVLATAEVRGRIFVNFGADWRQDFTVTIGKRDWPLFEAAGFDPLTLDQKRIRVRGLVQAVNGPSIAATHPEQVEVLLS